MDISEIKARLSIQMLLNHYGLEIKKGHVHCPFHEDKTPSMRVYEKTNTVFCFSGNCSKGNTPIDVIDFILHKENCSKHQAILKAKSLLGVSVSIPTLSETFKTLQAQVLRSKNAQLYLQKRGLEKLKEVGSNHRNGNTTTGYKYPHLKNCLVFPLKNSAGKVVSLYGRSIKNEQRNAHYYLTNRSGLYPGYPGVKTKHIILSESIIDVATLEQHLKLPSNTKVLACYGTNSFTVEHKKAVDLLEHLESISFFLMETMQV